MMERMNFLESWANTLIARIGPNAQSESLRLSACEYLRRLILETLNSNFSCSPNGFVVFRYGSVPLKTYLPDGDLDVGFVVFDHNGFIMADTTCDDYLNRLYQRLVMPDLLRHPIFPLRNATLIDADTRILKCFVGNIAVDISANKLGGCCAYVLLDLLDVLIGKNHLFKRSILFIKCWCAYESHTLGSRNGLMATYALEILIMNLFYLYFKILWSPLQVLMKFLEYYSNFEWKMYAVTACGPIHIEKLKELGLESQSSQDTSQSFLYDPHLERYAASLNFNEEGGAILGLVESCRRRFTLPYGGVDLKNKNKWKKNSAGAEFVIKSMNIVDPLNNGNNVGRSISESCYYRISASFQKGFYMLSSIRGGKLSFDFCNTFFKNTFLLLYNRAPPEHMQARIWFPAGHPKYFCSLGVYAPNKSSLRKQSDMTDETSEKDGKAGKSDSSDSTHFPMFSGLKEEQSDSTTLQGLFNLKDKEWPMHKPKSSLKYNSKWLLQHKWDGQNIGDFATSSTPEIVYNYDAKGDLDEFPSLTHCTANNYTEQKRDAVDMKEISTAAPKCSESSLSEYRLASMVESVPKVPSQIITCNCEATEDELLALPLKQALDDVPPLEPLGSNYGGDRVREKQYDSKCEVVTVKNALNASLDRVYSTCGEESLTTEQISHCLSMSPMSSKTHAEVENASLIEKSPPGGSMEHKAPHQCFLGNNQLNNALDVFESDKKEVSALMHLCELMSSQQAGTITVSAEGVWERLLEASRFLNLRAFKCTNPSGQFSERRNAANLYPRHSFAPK
ncbi:hypothetical protein IE077_003094 [Cardiosporidium cionae]|uniref:PAP/OAS1 substrate-binding-related domain-containing protein n=1 Tax=Cardiosporidium cionae TaxID=476202 RepID=A0ABQ7J937_9APIC|nr:hypothetical protein IE077_003094 [Cardiosporidium cionae]|eukprot:KAF8820513.1 hypothetical protein IE077_003094 [Cardiosporidium cionae]